MFSKCKASDDSFTTSESFIPFLCLCLSEGNNYAHKIRNTTAKIKFTTHSYFPGHKLKIYALVDDSVSIITEDMFQF